MGAAGDQTTTPCKRNEDDEPLFPLGCTRSQVPARRRDGRRTHASRSRPGVLRTNRRLPVVTTLSPPATGGTRRRAAPMAQLGMRSCCFAQESLHPCWAMIHRSSPPLSSCRLPAKNRGSSGAGCADHPLSGQRGRKQREGQEAGLQWLLQRWSLPRPRLRLTYYCLLSYAERSVLIAARVCSEAAHVFCTGFRHSFVCPRPLCSGPYDQALPSESAREMKKGEAHD